MLAKSGLEAPPRRDSKALSWRIKVTDDLP